MVLTPEIRPVTGSAEERDEIAAAAKSEIAALRGKAVTLTRELGVLRWQFSQLLEEQPRLKAGVRSARGMLRRNFPRAVEKAARLKQIMSSYAATSPVRVISDTQTAARFGAQLVLRTPVLLVAEGPRAEQITAAVRADAVVRVTPGAGLLGNLPIPPRSLPTLSGAAPDSLAAYLTGGGARLRRMSTIVVDAGDEISLALLRGRLISGQSLLLIHGSAYSSVTASELGTPSEREGNYALHTTLPAEWLDPLDECGRPQTDLTSGIYWPKISVVMVSFNQANFLEEGLRSVLEQGYPDLEFIVIDGDSKDGSVEILERYRGRLSMLLIEPDKGQADGLNKGFARATGDILTWVNSDDLLEPGALFRVAQAFSAHRVDMVAGGCIQIGLSRSQIIHKHQNKLPYGVPVTLPLGLLLEMDRFWLNGCFFYQPEVFFSRSIWNRSGGRLRTDLNYVLDYDLWVRMAAAGATILHIPDFLACSRTHDQQKTTVGMPYLPEVQRLLREYASNLLTSSPSGV